MQYTNVRQFKNNIYYIGYENNERVQYKDFITPTLYVKSNVPTEYKTLTGDYVIPKEFDNVSEAKSFIKDYEYVSDFKVFGYEKFHYIYLSDKFPEIKFDTNLVRKFYFDIETTTEFGFPNVNDPQEQILCITLYDSYTGIYNVYGTFDIQLNEQDCLYYYFTNEVDMLWTFLNYWQNNYPDIIVGWNSHKFDIPYIIARINLVVGEAASKKLSPWGMVHTKTEYDFGNEHTVYDIVGVSHLDYMLLYKKFTYQNQESYSLDYIANVELGAEKLDHSEYATFREFYEQNPLKFVVYNTIDCKLMLRLEAKMKLVELAIVVAYDAKINFNDVFSQICCWDNIIYNFLKEKNIVVPSKAYVSKDEKFEGAFVKEPIPGMYEWIVSFDLNSLYPHIIQALNISPETRKHHLTNVEVDKVLNEELDFSELEDYCVSPSGSLYDRYQEGMLSQLMSKYYSERKHYKKLQLQAEQEYIDNPNEQLISDISTYKNIQMAKKIAMNSAYGVLGSPFFRYYDLKNATSITNGGQVAIRWVSDRINKYVSELIGTDKDRIVANDTDSLFLNFKDLIKLNCKSMTEKEIVLYLDNFCETTISPKIVEIYKDLGDYLHFHKHCLVMARDAICSKFLIKGKKRYIANVWVSETVYYPEVKMKIVGLETARSSTPKVYRDKLKESYKIIMNSNNQDLIKYISDVLDYSKTLGSKELSVSRSVSDVRKYTHSSGSYTKGTPIGARSAILYNQFIVENNLQHKYKLIQNGDKIKTVYLTLPNPIHENSIAFFGSMPVEMELEKYIDYDLQIEKCFINPLQDLLNIIGWTTTEQNTLENFLF